MDDNIQTKINAVILVYIKITLLNLFIFILLFRFIHKIIL